MTRVKSPLPAATVAAASSRPPKVIRGTRRRLYRAAKEAVRHALKYAYMHRRHRKGDFRRIWISRINAASRASGMTYSRFTTGLKSRQDRAQPQDAG